MLYIKNWLEVEKGLLEAIELKTTKALQQYGNQKIKELLDRVPVASGKLKKSIGMKLKKGLNAILVIAAEAEYAQYVDTGTLPGHHTSVARLRDWGRKGKGFDESTIFKIRQDIFEHGTKAKPFWSDTFGDRIDSDFEAIFNKVKI